MKSVSLSSERHLDTRQKPRILDRLAFKLVIQQLKKIQLGRLVLIDRDQQFVFGVEGDLIARIHIHDRSFYSDIAFGGSIGAGEAYMRGAWSCDDLVTLVRLLVRNINVVDDMEGGTAALTRPFQKLFHWVNRNTREGARRNISAHYDLGNDFFSSWLDSSMMYSSAIFPTADASLHEAQIYRLNHICNQLQLSSSDHLVEIGTGWGSMAIHAVHNFGCRVTTTTLSLEQYEHTLERVKKAGLEDQITVLLQDYRDLEGTFDKLVSIEMIEAIGWQQFDTYFAKCGELLKPGGRLLIQAITIADQRYENAKRSVDFIQRYIFPGSNLPSISAMTSSIARKSDLLVTGLEDIGLHYAKTLRYWRQAFLDQLPLVREMGYSDDFIRMWEFYLCYCEGGFLERAISDVHLIADRPLHPYTP